MGDSNQYQNRSVQKPAQIIKPRVLKPLTDDEQLVIRSRRDLIHKNFPELIDHLSELVAMGLIDGWRNVTKVELIATGEVV